MDGQSGSAQFRYSIIFLLLHWLSPETSHPRELCLWLFMVKGSKLLSSYPQHTLTRWLPCSKLTQTQLQPASICCSFPSLGEPRAVLPASAFPQEEVVVLPSHLLDGPLVEGEGQVVRDKAPILLPWRC